MLDRTLFHIFSVIIVVVGFSFSLPDRAVAQQSAADVLVAQATLVYDDKRYEEALRLLQQALAKDPDNVDAWYYTGLTNLALERPTQAIEALEKAYALDPSERLIWYQLGVAYFGVEQYDKAEPLLTSLFEEQPQLENLGYYVGFMRYRHSDYQGALQAFGSGESKDTTVRQLSRFYTGLAAANLGLRGRAVREVEQASRLSPSSPLTVPADRLRDQMVASQQQGKRLQAELRIGGFYDDNVPLNPRPGNDPFSESLRTRKSHSTGETASARFDYTWLRRGGWEATGTYSFYQTLNNSLSFYNLQNHLGGVGAVYRDAIGALPYQLGALYTYDFLTLNEAAFLQRHTATFFGTLLENPHNLTTVLGRVQGKDFLNDAALVTAFPAENRDGVNLLAGLTHLVPFEAGRHFLKLGYQFDREFTEGSNYAYSGHRILTGGQYTLPLGNTQLRDYQTRLSYTYEVHFRDYNSVNTVFPTFAPNTVARRDTEQFHIARIEQPLPKRFTLVAEYFGDVSRSNLSIFSFNRNVFSLFLAWQY